MYQHLPTVCYISDIPGLSPKESLRRVLAVCRLSNKLLSHVIGKQESAFHDFHSSISNVPAPPCSGPVQRANLTLQLKQHGLCGPVMYLQWKNMECKKKPSSSNI